MTTNRDTTLQPAYILHSRRYRDSSLMLELFSLPLGKYAVIAKGIRGRKPKQSGGLQPFTPLLINSIGKGELKLAGNIDYAGNGYQLTGERLLIGLYINELLYHLLPRFDPMPGLFSRYQKLLSQLQDPAFSLNLLRQFELYLLQELGYGINFQYEANQTPIQPAAFYQYRVHRGFHLLPVNTGNNQAIAGKDILAMAAGRFSEVRAAQLKSITRRSIEALLGDKTLNSRWLFMEAGK